ncbi:MAG: hypothetical protein DMG96_01805 [Acidobacteria bacterium]|nr:MAG: hypothetical protein DMG96_01805 [Acidobacteriota bacterium]
MLSPTVSGSGEGDYWAFLAVNKDDTAFVTDAKPVVDEQSSHGADMHWKRNAETAAWIIRGGLASKVNLR